MGYRIAQPNFSKGELAPHLWGRFDVDAYQTAVRKARNCYVLKYGGLEKRPGTRFVAEVLDDSGPVRLIPFQFSIEQAYALEMGQGYMRVAALGGLVLNEQLAITGITNETQAKITASYHGYSFGDEIYLSGIAAPLGDDLNGRIFTVVVVVDEHNFRINGNTVGMASFSGAEGGITRTGAPAPDPTPPTVPPVIPPPEPPPVGGGGGDGRDPNNPYGQLP